MVAVSFVPPFVAEGARVQRGGRPSRSPPPVSPILHVEPNQVGAVSEIGDGESVVVRGREERRCEVKRHRVVFLRKERGLAASRLAARHNRRTVGAGRGRSNPRNVPAPASIEGSRRAMSSKTSVVIIVEI